MSKQIQFLMPRAGWNCELKGHGSCTIDEFGALIEPRYNAYKEQVRRCVSGLTTYAAQQAATHQEAQLPMLRDMIIVMAGYWDLDEGLDKEVYARIERQYGGGFDRAVSNARQSGKAPDLTNQAKHDILTGLEVHAQELSNDDGLENWIQESDRLAHQLRAEWQMGPEPEQQDVLTITMEGMGW